MKRCSETWFRDPELLSGRITTTVTDYYNVYMCVYILSAVLCSVGRVWLFLSLWTVALQAPVSMGFSRQEYWSWLPFPPPGDLPDPGISTFLKKWSSHVWVVILFSCHRWHPGLAIKILYSCTILYRVHKLQQLEQDTCMWHCMPDTWTNHVIGHRYTGLHLWKFATWIRM